MSDSSSDSSDDSVSSVSSVDSSDEEEDNQTQQAPVENTWKEWAAGDWGYILNTKFCAFDKETTLNTRAWVVKLESLSAKECVVRWFKLIELGSNIFNWTNETWAEEKDALKPLYYVTVKNEKSVEVNDTFDPNFDFCAVCKDMGELICCSACPKSFHLKCAELSDMPNDEGWVCVNCKPYEKKKRKPRKSKNDEKIPTEENKIQSAAPPPPAPTTAGSSTPTKTTTAAPGPSSPAQEKTKHHKENKSLEHKKKRNHSEEKSQESKKRRKHEHKDVNKHSKPVVVGPPPTPLPGKPGPRILMKTTAPRGPNTYPHQINRTVTSINNIKPSPLIKYTQKPMIPNTKPTNPPNILIGRGPSVLPTPSVRPNKLVLKTPFPPKPPASTTNGHSTPSLLPGKHILPQSLQPHMKAPILPSKPEPMIVTTTPLSVTLKLPSTTNPTPLTPTPKSPNSANNTITISKVISSPTTPPPKPPANPSSVLSSILRVSPPHSPPIEELGSDDEKEKIPNLWDYVNKQLAAVSKQQPSLPTTNKPVADPRLTKIASSPSKNIRQTTAVSVAPRPTKVIIRPVDLYHVFPLFLKLHAPTSNVPALNISQLIASAKVQKSKPHKFNTL